MNICYVYGINFYEKNKFIPASKTLTAMQYNIESFTGKHILTVLRENKNA